MNIISSILGSVSKALKPRVVEPGGGGIGFFERIRRIENRSRKFFVWLSIALLLGQATGPAIAGVITSITLTSNANPSPATAPVTFTATVNGSSPTGIVSFLDGTTILGSSVMTNGVATLGTSNLPVGIHSITASYPGDINNNASTSGNLTQVRGNVGTVVNLNLSANSGTLEGSVTFSATVIGTNPTGTVAFKDGPVVLSTVALTGTANTKVVTYVASQMPIGTHSITAVYSGDTLNPTGISPAIVQLIENPVAIKLSALSSVVGEAVTPSVIVTGAIAGGVAQLDVDGTILTSTSSTTTTVTPNYTCPAGATLTNGSCITTVTSVAANPVYTCLAGSTQSGSNCVKTATAGQGACVAYDYGWCVSYATVYSCSSGWALSGSTCSSPVGPANSTVTGYTCAAGLTLSGSNCISTVTVAPTSTAVPVYSCPIGKTLNGPNCEGTTTIDATVNYYADCPAGSSRTGANCVKAATYIYANPVTYCDYGCYSACPAGFSFINNYTTCVMPVSTPVVNGYTCSAGFSLSGTTCTQPANTKLAACPAGNTLVGTNCVIVNTANATPVMGCTSGTLYDLGCQVGSNMFVPSIVVGYSCPAGYSLSGTTCTQTVTTPTVISGYTCAAGWTLNGTTCVQPTTSAAQIVAYTNNPVGAQIVTYKFAPIANLTTGAHVFNAKYSGYASGKFVTTTARHTVANYKSSVAVSAVTNPVAKGAVYGASATLTGVAPTGAVTMTIDGVAAALQTTTQVSPNVVKFDFVNNTALTVGAHKLVATYAGDGKNTPSTSRDFTLMVNNAGDVAPTLTLNSGDSSVDATMVFSNMLPGLTGTLYFADLYDNGVLVQTLTPATSAAMQIVKPAPGAHSYYAILRYYSSPGVLAKSFGSNSVDVFIKNKVDIAATGSSNIAILGTSATLFAKMAAHKTGYQDTTGTVTFKDTMTGATIGVASVLDDTAALAITPALVAGSYSITATYSGDDFYMPATSKPLAVTVAASSSSAVTPMTWMYGYDQMSRLNNTLDPNGIQDYKYYDMLGRLIQTQGPAANGSTTPTTVGYAYDNNNSLVAVTDPRNLQTTYTPDGLGQTKTQLSPDSGTSTFTYDVNGNVLTKTDARGKVTTMTYDALNRLKTVTYPTGTPTTLTYDVGMVGTFSGVTDASGSIAYAYDAAGRMISKTQVTGTKTFVTKFAWSNTGSSLDQLTSITYPSGNVVNYTYDAVGRATAVTVSKVNPNGVGVAATASPFISGIGYNAVGAVTGWSWSDASTLGFDFDGYNQLIGYNLGKVTGTGAAAGEKRVMSRDPAGRITGYTHTSNGVSVPALDQAFVYDKLGRLTNTTLNGASTQYNYDATGNRTSKVVNGTTYTNFISSTSNRQVTVQDTGGTFNVQYDASGNVTSDGVNTYTYSDRGRMDSVTTAGGVVSYSYNSADQRVSKTGPVALVPTGAAYFVYDESGKVLGEYDANGAPVYETIYMGSTPAGVIKQTGTAAGNNIAVSLFNVYADHLGAPRVITAQADQSIVWRWDTAESYGGSAPTSGLVTNTCPTGYTLSGTTCSKAGATYAPTCQWDAYNGNYWCGTTASCPSGGTLAGPAPYYISGSGSTVPLMYFSLSGLYCQQPTSTVTATATTTGAFVYNARFPGQTFDAETGLFQNMRREYNPRIGRYMQSDPIGLKGGMNTYEYVGGAPTMLVDPTGEFAWAVPLAVGVGAGLAAAGATVAVDMSIGNGFSPVHTAVAFGAGFAAGTLGNAASVYYGLGVGASMLNQLAVQGGIRAVTGGVASAINQMSDNGVVSAGRLAIDTVVSAVIGGSLNGATNRTLQTVLAPKNPAAAAFVEKIGVVPPALDKALGIQKTAIQNSWAAVSRVTPLTIAQKEEAAFAGMMSWGEIAAKTYAFQEGIGQVAQKSVRAMLPSDLPTWTTMGGEKGPILRVGVSTEDDETESYTQRTRPDGTVEINPSAGSE